MSDALDLADLVACEYFRDGGSYQAVFRTASGASFTLALLVNSWDHPRDKRYTDLFETRLDDTEGATPVGKGSPREQIILAALHAWVGRQPGDLIGPAVKHLERLHEMIDEIPHRVPT